MENKTVVLVPPGNVGKHMRESLEANENIVVVDTKPCKKVLIGCNDFVDAHKLLKAIEGTSQPKERYYQDICTGRKSDRKRNRKTRWS
ncbi:hypothetical protein [Vibrio phage phiKT1024]|nr:hypothetical protein [Vibrio phage phiKT1024]